MPLAIEQFDLSEYDLIISSSFAVAKGVITGPDQLHVSYVHSPIRYAWDLQYEYLKTSGLNRGLKGWIAKWQLHKIRLWDYRTANGVDAWIANSSFIARRIWKIYRREASIIYPPVDVTNYLPSESRKEHYFTLSRLVPYKRIDLIVEAFGQMPDKELVVIGDGPEAHKIRALCPKNVELLGYQSAETVQEYMKTAKAFIFAAQEDFGIVPVEAQACGVPVIAYGKGGVLDTVKDGETGLLFYEQTVPGLVDAVKHFEDIKEQFNVENSSKSCRKFFRRAIP